MLLLPPPPPHTHTLLAQSFLAPPLPHSIPNDLIFSPFLLSFVDYMSATIGCQPSQLTVLLAGCTGELATLISRKLVQRGVALERVLYCEYF